MAKNIYLRILSQLDTGIIVISSDRNIIYWNDWMYIHCGYSPELVKSHKLMELFPELIDTRIDRAVFKALDYKCPSILSAKLLKVTFPLYKKSITSCSKTFITQSVLVKPIELGDEDDYCIISISDTSSADLREKALREQSHSLNNIIKQIQKSDNQFKLIFDSTTNGIIVFEESGKIISSNGAGSAIFGYPEDHFSGADINIDSIMPGTKGRIKYFKEHIESKNNRQIMDFEEVEVIRHDGETIFLSYSFDCMPIKNSKNKYFVSFNDITEKKRTEEALFHLAKYDSLTNLPNRNNFFDIANRALNGCDRRRELVSVLFIDIDRFKTVNDTYGHNVGDRLLQEVSIRLTNCLRKDDIVARLSGDEFAIVAKHNVDDRAPISIAEKIISEIGKAFIFDGNEIHIGSSIGIAQYPEDGKDIETLLTKADRSMYDSKNSGGNLVRFFTNEMNRSMQTRIKMEVDIRRAIENNEFEMYFQPLINLSDSSIYGVETLIRWHRPNCGLVLPEEFISTAEECGLIVQLGDWIIENALSKQRLLTETLGEGVRMTINLSPRQFRDSSLADKLEIFIENNLADPNFIVFEITEGHLLEGGKQSVDMLKKIKKLGFSIAIDDFGTGYSSFSYLRDLPIEILKIDKSFLIDSENDATSLKLVSCIVDLAHALDLTVIAEGVESETIKEFLQGVHCDIGQGYYFDKPLSINDLLAINSDKYEKGLRKH